MHRRVDPLADDTRSLLATAAVIGREFDVALLQTATGLSSSVVLQQLTAAATAGVVEEHDRVGAFRFTHALIREMLYADLLPVTRAGIHHRVATALEAAHGAEDAALGALAFHYFHAAPLGVAAKAFEFSMRAADVASRLLAHGDAMAHYERALAALSFEPPDDRRRAGVSQALGLAAWLAGHNPKARDHYRIAARCARTVDDRHGLVFAAMGHARASPPSGAPDPASVALLEEALAAVPAEDGAARAMLLAMLGRALYFSPELARCHAVTAEAVEMARRVGDRTALTVALLCRQLALLGPGAVEERVALADESLRLASEPGVDLGTHESRLTRTLCLLERGEIGAATREVDLMRASADRARLPERQWHATVHRATLAHLAGDFESAASLAAQAIAVRRDASDPAVSHVFVVQTFLCRSETGNLEGLEESVRALARDYPAVPAWRCVLALLLAETGRPDEARGVLDAIAPDDFAALRRDFLFPAALAWLARVVALLGDRERARVVGRLLAPFTDRNIVISLYSPGCLGSAETYLGLVATTLGELDAAARHFEAGLAMNTRMGARPLIARTQHAYARMLVARDRTGDRARAAALVAAARESAQACGMTTLLAELADDRTPAAAAPVEQAAGDPVIEATLRREPDCWTVSYGGDSFQLKDTKGLVFLHTLLAHPGRDVHVLDLAAGHAGGDASSARQAGEGSELLDGAARVAYKERLEDLRDELDEAERFNDLERAARARREIEFLSEELARAVGLGGRDRRAASAAERARVNVTRTIAAVLKKIADASPALGQHLAATVRTGYFCSYAPDPRMPTVWRL
jgi:tetratricopeptide (TPR) repeat protein